MKTLLVALLLLVVGTGTAFAECAWVLWSDLIVRQKGGDTVREWELAVAVATMADCHEQMRRQIELRVKAGEKLMFGDTLTSEAAGMTVLRRLICLPDTVDPRGPKGK